jgi:integrase
MSTLRTLLQDYLSMRRALGYKLRSDGASLLSFVSFMEQEQAEFISTSKALAWATLPKSAQKGRWSARLCYVRGFASYCRAFDPRTEVPPTGLLPIHYQRSTPFFFSDDHIHQLLQASLQICPSSPFVGKTYYCLFGLLSVSGLRISEALGLALDNVDLEEGILSIYSSKFGKSRLIPLHSSTVDVLADYRVCREQFLAGRQVPYWFINGEAKRLSYDAVRDTFLRLLEGIDLCASSGNRKPHLHDLRHRFAVVTLLQWYRAKENVEQKLPILSTYLGHVEIRDTYWYLSAFPELMEIAAARLDQRWEQVS